MTPAEHAELDVLLCAWAAIRGESVPADVKIEDAMSRSPECRVKHGGVWYRLRMEPA